MNISQTENTVCICTYNRSNSLSRTLKSFKTISNTFNWELLLVDNNSTDNTKDTIKAFNDDLPIKYVKETAQGLSHARNRAINECFGDLLIFTDDDVQVTSSWISEFISAANHFPEADYFGGKVLPYWPSGRPNWLSDESISLLGGLFVRYDLGTATRMFADGEPTPFGASFAVRRRLFEHLEPFRTDLGPIGTIPGRGDDSEYLGRARDMGFKGAYVGKSVCYHWVDPNRLKLTYMYRFGIQKGIAEVLMNRSVESNGSLGLELWFAIRGLWQLIKGRGDRFRQCVINMGIQAGLRRASRKKRSDHFKKCL